MSQRRWSVSDQRRNMRAQRTNRAQNAMSKLDAILAQNPDTSLDDLVAARKINADQRAQALKKPGLQAQISQLEEQITHYRQFDQEHQAQLQKQKEQLTALHQKDLEKAKEDLRLDGVTSGAAELRKSLLIFS